MKFYVSARYSRRPEAESVARALQDAGHDITSRWVWRDQPDDYHVMTHEEVAEFAEEDITDVLQADAILALSEATDNTWGRGGRHVEFGVALGTGKLLFVLGPLENIFHYMADVAVVDNLDQLLEYLREETNGSYTGTSGGDSQERSTSFSRPRDFRLQPVEMPNPRDNTVW